VRINGQVYALWYNGQFGEDNLYLLRPFGPSGSTPAVTIRYRYTLNDIRSPEKDQPLTPALNDGKVRPAEVAGSDAEQPAQG
jgi:hypothetical protein